MARKKRGVRRMRGGWQAYFTIVGLPQITKQFPLATPYAVMAQWREDERAKYKRAAPGSQVGTFGADIEDYLARRAAMPTIEQVGYMLNQWADLLGRDRVRAGITARELDVIMQGWLKAAPRGELTGRGRRRGRPAAAGGLSPDTVRKRRATLLAMWNYLDGPAAHNEVRASAAPKPTPPADRGVDYPAVYRVLAAIPDFMKGSRRPVMNKLRACVVAHTGFPPITLQRLRSQDIDLIGGFARCGRRLKGGGVAACTIKLQPPAVAAFAALIAAGGMDVSWSTHALNQLIKRAIRRPGVNVPPAFCLYDLRHSFAAQLLRAPKGTEAAVARALMHAPGSKHTARYTRGAHAEVDAEIAAQMGATLAAIAVAASPAQAVTMRKKHARKDKPLPFNHLTLAV